LPLQQADSPFWQHSAPEEQHAPECLWVAHPVKTATIAMNSQVFIRDNLIRIVATATRPLWKILATTTPRE
jgi:hypothetical protein